MSDESDIGLDASEGMIDLTNHSERVGNTRIPAGEAYLQRMEERLDQMKVSMAYGTAELAESMDVVPRLGPG